MSDNTLFPVLRASTSVLRAHPRMALFPLLGVLGSITAVAAVVAVVRLASGDQTAMRVPAVAVPLIAYLAFVVQRLWSVTMRVALTRAAVEAFRERDWTVPGMVRIAVGRIGAIASYVIIQAGARWLLRQVRQNAANRGLLGFVANQAAQTAWWVASYFVMPVLACEQTTGPNTVRRSTELFKQTWREAFVGRIRLDVIWGLAALFTLLGTLLFAWMDLEDIRVLAWLAFTPWILAIPLVFVGRMLDTVHRAALYLFAIDGMRPGAFEDEDLDPLFHT